MKYTKIVGILVALSMILAACGAEEVTITPVTNMNDNLNSNLNDNGNLNGNLNDNGNLNGNLNANTNGNANANANTNGNANANGNTNANTNNAIGTGTPAAGGGIPVTGAVTVNVAQDPTFGAILVDGDGMSLYINTVDDIQGAAMGGVGGTGNTNANANGNANANTNTAPGGTGTAVSNCTGDCLAEWPPLIISAGASTGGVAGNSNGNANLNGNNNGNANANSNGNVNSNLNTNTNTNANANTNGAGGGTSTGITGLTAGPGVDVTLLGTITRDDGSIQVTYNGWPLYRFSGDLAPGDTNGQADEDAWFLVSPTGTPVQ